MARGQEHIRGSIDPERARMLMGSNFIGPDELRTVARDLPIDSRFVNRSGKRLPPIRCSESDLRSCRRSYLLILGVPVDAKGNRLTINRMRAYFGINPAVSEPCFYNQDWYLKEKFANETSLQPRWYLLRRSVLRNTRGRQPSDSEKSLEANQVLPPAILVAFAFFANYFVNEGEILFKHEFLWCADHDRNGDQIYVGRYEDPARMGKNGFGVHRHLAIRKAYGIAPMSKGLVVR